MIWRPAALAIAAIGAPAAAQGGKVTVMMGTPVRLVTAQVLSSKTHVKGDMVALRVAEDVLVDGRVAIPKNSPATGQISDARAKGAMGMGGKLMLRPLYLRVGDRVVRLAGAEDDHGGVQAGAVVGMALLGPMFTGKSAVLQEGARLNALVAKTAVVFSPR